MNYSASVLFVKKADIFETTCADFQRVKPYREKFGVGGRRGHGANRERRRPLGQGTLSEQLRTWGLRRRRG